MNLTRLALVSITLLLAGGCATVDRVATTPAEPAQTAPPSRTKSLHVINLPQQPSAAGQEALAVDDITEEIDEPEKEFWDQVRAGFRLPDTSQSRVRKRTAGYGRNPGQVERIFERGQPYLAYILSEVKKRDFPTEIVLLPFVESGYDPFAFSYGRAAGMWQFIPATGKMYGLQQDWWYDGRRDVVESTRAALNYLDYLQNKFDGDWLLAIAAYNSGSGAVSKAIKKNRSNGRPTDFWHLDLPRETAAYVPKLLAISNIVREPETYDISLVPVDPEPAFTVVETHGQLDISVAAELAGMDTESLYLLNPGYNRWTTHPDGPHTLVVPVAHSDTFDKNIATLPDSERTRLHRHKVRQGETLSHIAQQYNTTTKALMSSNQLDKTLIRSGQYLLVPVGNHDSSQYAQLNRRILAASESASKQTYRVRAGDSLWTIARRHNVTVKQVSGWNKLDADRPIRPGQKLVIYKGGATGSATTTRVRTVVYTVRNGDSLYRISKKFNVSVNDLVRWNNLTRDKHLQPGQSLKLYVDVTQQSGQSRG
jgi:membrane-bound lytic murein transglycosylase D